MRIKKTNPTLEQLSQREQTALQFIQKYRETRRKAPSLREIAGHIKLSLGGTHELVNRLVEYGYLQKITRRQSHRNLRVKRPDTA